MPSRTLRKEWERRKAAKAAPVVVEEVEAEEVEAEEIVVEEPVVEDDG